MPLPRSRSAGSSTSSSRQQRARSAHDVFIPAGRWQVDSICGVCSKSFNVMRGRHHCRHCGMSVCGKHSKNRAVVPTSLSSTMQRVCDICFPQCQRGITRKRRNTVRPRTISLRFDTDSTTESSTTASQRTDNDSATSSARSAPAGRPKSASTPDRRREPKPPLSARSAKPAAIPEGEQKIISIQDLIRMRKQQGQATLQEPQLSANTAAFPASNQQILQYPSRMRRAYTSAAPPQESDASRMQTRQEQTSRREPPLYATVNAEKNSAAIPNRMQRANTSAAIPGDRQQHGVDRMRRHEEQTPLRDSATEKIKKALAAIAANKQQAPPASKVLQSERRPLPFRRRAATAADAKPRRSRISFSSSGSEESISSLNDSSASELSSSSDDDSDDEELIAKYLRRGVPLKSTSPAKPVELKRMDSSLAAIKEQQALSTSPELDGFDSTPIHKPLLRSSRSSYLAHKPQNRKMSSISIGTISVTDSEGYEGEEEEDNDDDAERKSNSGMGTSDVVTISDCDEEEELPEPEAEAQPLAPRLSAKAAPPPPPVYVGPVKSIATQDPESSSPKEVNKILLASDGEHTPVNAISRAPPAKYQITNADRRLMRQIEELELEIQKCQCELPVLLEKLKQSERTAAQLQREVAESRARVQQYRKAHHVVNRSLRAAKTLMREQEYQAAVLELLRATSIDRSSAVAWFLLAECRLRLGQLQDAEVACRKCVRLVQHPNSGASGGGAEVALLGKILQDQGRHDEAIECYLTALQR
uniref:FYVE-type domain-containing protein n=1 Tax=Globisporangium ultimum (strain ATCC 200006 / CBS 805.95 / DAOM BR144) TaxID=431595 RepID=K3W6J3_GLOUD